MEIIASVILSFLLGFIPFGYIVVRLWKNVDIRQHGSGNIGFTNALRVAGKIPGIIVLLFDIGKGMAAVLLVSKLAAEIGETAETNKFITELFKFTTMPALCGLAAIIGHDAVGGKGISTTIGVFLALKWPVMLVGLVVWFAVVIFTRYVSLGSILLVVSLPIATFVFHRIPQVELENWGTIFILSVVVAALAIFKHRRNIGRLLRGTERKIR